MLILIGGPARNPNTGDRFFCTGADIAILESVAPRYKYTCPGPAFKGQVQAFLNRVGDET